MDFNFWYNEIADMPQRNEKGEWYDLETGIAFKDYVKSNSVKKEKKIPKKYLAMIEEVKRIQSLDWKNVPQDEKKYLYESLQILRTKKYI